MTELYNILPADLRASFESLDYEEEGGLTVQSIDYLDNELHFTFSIFLGDINQNETQSWKLQVLNYRDGKIDTENLGGYFSFYSEHFLLSEFSDSETELYFRKRTNNSEKLFAEIYKIHITVFDNYFPLEKFTNGSDLLKLCQADSGIFARGPKRVLKYYYDALNKAGSEPYYYGDFPPQKWDGEKWVPEDKNLKLVLLGGTYFIGTEFVYKRLN